MVLRVAAARSLSWQAYEAPVAGIGLLDAQKPCDPVGSRNWRHADRALKTRTPVRDPLPTEPPSGSRRRRCVAAGGKHFVREHLHGGSVQGAGFDRDAELMPPFCSELLHV